MEEESISLVEATENELTRYSLNFKSQVHSLLYQKSYLKSQPFIFIFSTITLLYCSCNLIFYCLIPNKDISSFFTVYSFIISSLTLILFICLFFSKNKASLHMLMIYTIFTLFSLNHIPMTRIFFYLNNEKNGVTIDKIGNTVYYFKVDFEMIRFLFLFADIIVKTLVTFFNLNNFVFTFFSNLITLTLNITISFIFLCDVNCVNGFNSSNSTTVSVYTDCFNKSISMKSTILLCFYGIFYFILILQSYIIEKKNKSLFLYKNSIEKKGSSNMKDKNDIIKSINVGYIKLNRSKAIVKMNKFFQDEEEFLNCVWESNKEEIEKENGGKMENAEYRNMNDFDLNEFLIKSVQGYYFNPKESKYFLQILFHNFELKYELTNSNTLNNSFFPGENRRNKKAGTGVKAPNKSILISEVKELLRSHDISEPQIDLFKKMNIDAFKEDKNNYKNFDVISFLMSNKSKFQAFTHIGRSVTIKGSDKILSLEVLARVNPDDTIELIFNDVSKHDLARGTSQFIVKSGQFLHDFKNPLFCIHNEISELKNFNDKFFEAMLTCGNLKENSEINISNIWEKANNIDLPRNIELDAYLKVQDKYEYIKNMSEYCQNMIGCYEDLSKYLFKPQNIKINIKNFDISDTIAFIQLMMDYKLDYSNKKVEFIVNSYIEDEDCFIASDENRIKQVLINLLTNAEKFTPSGQITLTVKREVINNKNYVKFWVEDTGIGMDDKAVNQLFTPFFSLNTQEMNKSGCGLGLVIVKDITERLGISIKASSEVEKGTKMWFYVEDHTEKPRDKSRNNYDNDKLREKRKSSMNKSREEILSPNRIDIDIRISNQNEKLEGINEHSNESFSDKQTIMAQTIREIMELKHPVNKGYLNKKPKNCIYSSETNIAPRKKMSAVRLYNKPTSSTNVNAGNINIYNNITNNSSYIIKEKANLRFNNLSLVYETNFEIKGKQTRVSKHYSKIVDISEENINKLFSVKYQKGGNSPTVSGECNFSTNLREENPSFLDINESVKRSVCKDTSHSPVTCKNKGFNYKTFSELMKRTRRISITENQSNKHHSQNFHIMQSTDNLNTDIIHVLIVDDMNGIRGNCKNLFKKVENCTGKYQFIIEEANDGYQALSLIFSKLNDNQFFDIIILDDYMSYLHGTDMLQVLHFIHESNFGLLDLHKLILSRVILCSSNNFEYFKTKVAFLTENQVCEKPFNLDFLNNLLRCLGKCS